MVELCFTCGHRLSTHEKLYYSENGRIAYSPCKRNDCKCEKYTTHDEYYG